jgi:hypothetical protein
MHEEAGNSMFDLKRKVMAVMIGCFLAAGALAQKGQGDRPPKPPNTVVVTPKPPPPSKPNQDDKKQGDKRGKN